MAHLISSSLVQGDREHHGGIFKAVYAYARETREAFAAERGEEFVPQYDPDLDGPLAG